MACVEGFTRRRGLRVVYLAVGAVCQVQRRLSLLRYDLRSCLWCVSA